MGGDFFDAFAFQDDKICFVVGDVTGKGLHAATFTAEVKFAIRAYVHETGEAARSLTLLNRFLCDWRGLVVDTFVVVVFDAATGLGTATIGGMEPPLIYRAGTGVVEEMFTRGMVLGADRNARV